MVANLGNPISADLNFQPGGNPIGGLAGGLPGLALSYGQSYNSYLSSNLQNYKNIIGGYDTLKNNIANTLGQGGTDWGIAQPAANQIVMQGRQAAGGAIQNSINSGVGKSTAAVAAQRGVYSDMGQALAGLGSNLAGLYAGYQGNLGQSQLNFMNSVNIPPPDVGAYSNLAQQYGAGQQQLANNALLARQQDNQMRMAGASMQAAGGGRGGVSIPNAPRGGTYGSGSGAFPSANAVQPQNYSGGRVGGSGGGGGSQIVYPSGNPWAAGGAAAGGAIGGSIGGMGGEMFDPFNPFGKTSFQEGDADPYTSGGIDPANGNYGDRAGMFGNTGLEL